MKFKTIKVPELNNKTLTEGNLGELIKQYSEDLYPYGWEFVATCFPSPEFLFRLETQ